MSGCFIKGDSSQTTKRGLGKSHLTNIKSRKNPTTPVARRSVGCRTGSSLRSIFGRRPENAQPTWFQTDRSCWTEMKTNLATPVKYSSLGLNFTGLSRKLVERGLSGLRTNPSISTGSRVRVRFRSVFVFFFDRMINPCECVFSSAVSVFYLLVLFVLVLVRVLDFFPLSSFSYSFSNKPTPGSCRHQK